MSMDMNNVQSEPEAQEKLKWPDVTAKGKIALSKIRSALQNQSSEEMFQKELMEAIIPVFNEVYTLVRTNVNGFDKFLEEFPQLHHLKHPNWTFMFQEPTFNAENCSDQVLKKQLTDMEIRLKSIAQNMPSTSQFIQVKCLRSTRVLIFCLRLW